MNSRDKEKQTELKTLSFELKFYVLDEMEVMKILKLMYLHRCYFKSVFMNLGIENLYFDLFPISREFLKLGCTNCVQRLAKLPQF